MDLEEHIEEMRSDIVKAVQEIVRIKSVEGPSLPGAPFGEGVNNALTYALNLSSSFGLKVKNIDGYIGYAEYGEGDEIVGVLGHLDVVPEGNGWAHPPFESRIADNKIYGRGAVDDKGPVMAALFGLKAIKDLGLTLGKRVRIMFGTDEESGWLDIEHYLKNEVPPDIGFTPDGMFPAINAEKGSMNIELKKDIVRKSKGMISIKSIKGGDAVNVVPDFCTCELRLKDMAKMMMKDTLDLYCQRNYINMNLQEKGDESVIISKGLPSHSSAPENGKNAITQLLMFISQFNLGQNDVADFIKFLSRYIGNELNGKSFGINFSDEVSGELTLNLGRISIDEDKASAVINIRYPVQSKYEDIIGKILQIAEDKKVQVSVLSHREPLFIDSSNSLITTLLKSYSDVTGSDAYPVSIGGQTYAKAFANMAAFGPVFPESEEKAHVADEFIDIEDLVKCTKIYARAIYELAK